MNTEWTTVAARYGRTGTKIHLGQAIEKVGRFGRTEWHLVTSLPLCGTYVRPGSGWPVPGASVTCSRCLAADTGR